MMIVDHGFLRLLYNNFHKIDDNMYRSNMPTPQRIKKYIRNLESKLLSTFEVEKKMVAGFLKKKHVSKME